jgi:hypothetical protein
MSLLVVGDIAVPVTTGRGVAEFIDLRTRTPIDEPPISA